MKEKQVVINFHKDMEELNEKNRKLIDMSLILTLIISITAIFPIFEDVIMRSDFNDHVRTSFVSELLTCEDKDKVLDTSISMTYEENDLYHYDVNYKFNLSNLNANQTTDVMARYNLMNNRILEFKEEAGFYYKNDMKYDAYGNLIEINLGYTISLKAVVNNEILELINGIEMSIDEKNDFMTNDGYICK